MIRQTKEGWWIIDGDSHVGKWVEDSGLLAHDINMLPRILPLIPEGGTVVDVGAYIGDHTIAYLNHVGPTGQVFAFEPQKDAFDCLIMNCPRACCFQVALSDRIGTGNIVLDSDRNYGACRVEAVDGKDAGVVEMMALDAMVLSPSFIKVDVEGHELRVLKGAVKTIARSKPVLLVEINESALNKQGTNGPELLKFIKELGYEWSNVYPRQECSGLQYDALCFPKP